jgi:hypothetical protein
MPAVLLKKTPRNRAYITVRDARTLKGKGFTVENATLDEVVSKLKAVFEPKDRP